MINLSIRQKITGIALGFIVDTGIAAVLSTVQVKQVAPTRLLLENPR
jgi:hypothetical protein